MYIPAVTITLVVSALDRLDRVAKDDLRILILATVLLNQTTAEY